MAESKGLEEGSLPTSRQAARRWEGSWRNWKTTEHLREESASLGGYLKSCPVDSQLLRVDLKPVH